MFLVTTLTSAASAATAQIIKDPLSAKDLLAENLPKATNFYISYFLLQGLTMSSMAVVQVAGVLVFKFMTTFFDHSPRHLYQRWSALSGISWGNVFPVFTNMGVIGTFSLSSSSKHYPRLTSSSSNILLHRPLNPRFCLHRPLSRLPGLPLQLPLRVRPGNRYQRASLPTSAPTPPNRPLPREHLHDWTIRDPRRHRPPDHNGPIHHPPYPRTHESQRSPRALKLLPPTDPRNRGRDPASQRRSLHISPPTTTSPLVRHLEMVPPQPIPRLRGVTTQGAPEPCRDHVLRRGAVQRVLRAVHYSAVTDAVDSP